MVVVARPSELAADAAAMEVVRALVPDDRWERFRATTGVDPRAVEAVAFGSYDDGTVLVFRGPFLARVVVAEMAHRMLVVDSSSDSPVVRRGGLYHGVRRDVMEVGEHEVMLVTGSPSLTGRALAALQGAEPRAFHGALASELLATYTTAPLAVHCPEPLALEGGTGVAMLLAREEALAATLVPTNDGRLGITVDVRGELPPGADANFRALVVSVAHSDLGSVVGMQELVDSLEVQTSDHRAVLTASIAPGAVARGLRALLLAEIEEVVGPVVAAPP